MWLKSCSHLKPIGKPRSTLVPYWEVTCYLVLVFTSCRAIRKHQPLTSPVPLNYACPLLGYLFYLTSNSSVPILIPITVDPWTTPGWIEQVHLHADFIQCCSTTWPAAGWICGCRTCRNGPHTQRANYKLRSDFPLHIGWAPLILTVLFKGQLTCDYMLSIFVYFSYHVSTS